MASPSEIPDSFLIETHTRSHSTTPRSRQSSPKTSPNFSFGGSSQGSPFPSSRFSNRSSASSRSSKFNQLRSWIASEISRFTPGPQQSQQFWLLSQHRGRRRAPSGRVWYRRKRVRAVLAVIVLVGLFFLMNWWMLSQLQDPKEGFFNGKLPSVRGKWIKFAKGKRSQRMIFSRMLALAAHALAEGERKPEPKDLWEESLVSASAWTPCADQRNWEPNEGRNGYILVSANGGINQQRVAVCNAVTLARLLNSTLVIPNFLFSSVWRDARDGEVTISNSTIS